jgi:hypothetical protein
MIVGVPLKTIRLWAAVTMCEGGIAQLISGPFDCQALERQFTLQS